MLKNIKATTPIRQKFEAHQLYGYAIDKDTTFATLEKFGISASKKAMQKAVDAFPEMFKTEDEPVITDDDSDTGKGKGK